MKHTSLSKKNKYVVEHSLKITEDRNYYSCVTNKLTFGLGEMRTREKIIKP